MERLVTDNRIPLGAMRRYRPNWCLRLLKFREKDGKRTWRFSWGSFQKQWGLRFTITQFSADHDYDHHWSLACIFFFGQFWIDLPKFLPRTVFGDSCHMDDLRSWGFSWIWADSDMPTAEICINLGTNTKYLRLPWNLEHYKTEVYLKDDSWAEPVSSWKVDAETFAAFDTQVAREIHPYRYVLRSGEVQECLATIEVMRIEWRRKGWGWSPLFNLVRQFIEITFSAEVGERSGSWKGGTIGCGFDLLYNELPVEALRRMQQTRKF